MDIFQAKSGKILLS